MWKPKITLILNCPRVLHVKWNRGEWKIWLLHYANLKSLWSASPTKSLYLRGENNAWQLRILFYANEAQYHLPEVYPLLLAQFHTVGFVSCRCLGRGISEQQLLDCNQMKNNR